MTPQEQERRHHTANLLARVLARIEDPAHFTQCALARSRATRSASP